MIQPFVIGLGPSSGTRPVIEITDAVEWTLDNNLDDGCSLQLSTRGTSLAAGLLQELASDLWLYRDGVLVQRFRVATVEQVWTADGENLIGIAGICYRRLLKNRYVRSALTYTGVSQGQIVWNLIDHAQTATGGSLGLTIGSLGPVVNRDRAYEVGQNIYDAIVDLTTISGGIAWTIDGQRQVFVSLQTAFPTQTQPVVLGVTAREISRPSTAERFANAAIVTGNIEATTPVIVADPGIGTDPRGRWERYVAIGNSDVQAELTEAANGALEEAISPLATWEVVMDPYRYFLDAEYEIGDLVTIAAPPYAVGASGTVSAQTISRRVNQTGDGDLTVTCTFIEVP